CLEFHPGPYAAVAVPTTSVSHHHNKRYLPSRTATPGGCLLLPRLLLLQPLSAICGVPVFPGTPPQHTAQTVPSPPRPYENCNTCTSSGRRAPVRKSRAFSSHKNSSISRIPRWIDRKSTRLNSSHRTI